jgi:hypothetical protein
MNCTEPNCGRRLFQINGVWFSSNWSQDSRIAENFGGGRGGGADRNLGGTGGSGPRATGWDEPRRTGPLLAIAWRDRTNHCSSRRRRGFPPRLQRLILLQPAFQQFHRRAEINAVSFFFRFLHSLPLLCPRGRRCYQREKFPARGPSHGKVARLLALGIVSD